MTTIEECPICYEALAETLNRCTTPCGHTLCFTCMIRYWNTHPAHTDYACPCCRTILLAVSPKTDSEDDSDSYAGNSDEEHREESHDEESHDEESHDMSMDDSASIERIAAECILNDITLTDVLAVLLSRDHSWQVQRRVNRPNSIYTLQYCQEIGTTLYDMMDELDDDCFLQREECVQMGIEDNDSKYWRSHRQLQEIRPW